MTTTKIISLDSKKFRQRMSQMENQSELLSKDNLLKYYVKEGTQVLQSLDNLGNFLMGFGVLMLGYLLNVNLKTYITHSFIENNLMSFSTVALFGWLLAVILLLDFMYLFVYHLIAGRSIHALGGSRDNIGKRISITKMSYEKFANTAPCFEKFINNNYLEEDQKSNRQLWYSTFRYTRYMAYRKLMIMNKMRRLLAFAMASGVLFKLIDIMLDI